MSRTALLLRTLGISAGLLFIALLVLTGCSVLRAPRVATAMSAHILCSETFVAGQDPDIVFDRYVTQIDGINVVAGALRYSVDDAQQSVKVSLLGSNASQAIYARGRGCTVLNGGPIPEPVDAPADKFSSDPIGAPDALVRSSNAILEAALDALLSDSEQAVKAVVILKGGRILSERYAAGYDQNTPLLSWSVAKSVVNALVGILVQMERLDVYAPAPLAAWSNPDNPHHDITIDQLLRQTSGQPFGAANNGMDRASQMLFLAPSTTETAARARFRAKPGEKWSYTDGNYAILSGVLREVAGESPSQFVAFAESELFGPLGMSDVTIEFDQSGNPMGAAFIYATARDWARFGQLYLDGGMIEGERILPEGWVDYSQSPTPQSDLGYGAGFWTNDGDSTGARRRRELGAPTSSYFASGNFGQHILILPDDDLVVVRFSNSQLGSADLFNGTLSIAAAARN